MRVKNLAGVGILLVFLLSVFIAGCDEINNLAKKGGTKKEVSEFKRGPSGLVMEFVKNYPGDRYIVNTGINEKITIMVDLRNKGTYPEDGGFKKGNIYVSGFDDAIIQIGTFSGTTFTADLSKKSKPLSGKYLPAASPINPLGGFDTMEFEGQIDANKITVDEYNPTIMATACYPYVTKASPNVCIDPLPFDDRQEKVCTIGSQALETQGAPVAVTSIAQEASTNKIQFKITMKNVGDGDVLKPDADDAALGKCSPLGGAGGRLDRKDFDRIQLTKVEIGGVNLLATDKMKCSPFADDTAKSGTNLIQLFNGEGFIICTLDINNAQSQGVFTNVQSAYTTPLSIELGYNYRSTISKPIKISKLTTVS